MHTASTPRSLAAQPPTPRQRHQTPTTIPTHPVLYPTYHAMHIQLLSLNCDHTACTTATPHARSSTGAAGVATSICAMQSL